MADNDFNKEMVDLAMMIKKYLREKYDIAIALADPELLDKLVKLKNMDDPVLQGMLAYLMALAGPEWSSKLSSQDPTAAPREPGAGKKRMFGRYRGKSVTSKADETHRKSVEERHGETLHRSNHLADGKDKPGEAPPRERKPLRYYRGQPIYDD